MDELFASFILQLLCCGLIPIVSTNPRNEHAKPSDRTVVVDEKEIHRGPLEGGHFDNVDIEKAGENTAKSEA